MGIVWAASADKHGIDHEDALYAILNQTYHIQHFDEPRVDSGIFHVMEARRNILDIAERQTGK